MKKHKASTLLIAFVKLTGAIPALIFYKPKVYFVNKEKQSLKLPKPCILMSNHTSLLDFPLYLLLFPWRTLRFLIAEVMFNKGRAFAAFLYGLGGIFVDRNVKDVSFISDAVSILDGKGTVGVFPEGRLPVGGKSFPFKPGVVLIALNSGAPIVPVCTDGNYGLFRRSHVLVGEPIILGDYVNTDVPDEAEYDRLTALLEEKMNIMKADLAGRVGKRK